MSDNSEKLALSIPETAKILDVSVPTAYELTRRADFPAFRIGRRTLVDRAGLEHWVSLQAGAARNSEAAALERGSRT